MVESMSRRQFVGTVALIGIAGCDKTEAENAAKTAAKVAGFIGVLIGQKLLSFPHLASKIAGVTLLVAAEGSTLIIEYFYGEGEDEKKAKFEVKLDKDSEHDDQARVKISDDKKVSILHMDSENKVTLTRHEVKEAYGK